MRTKKNRGSILIVSFALSLAGLPPVVPCLFSGTLTSFYKEGDWIALTDFRFVNSLDFDSRVVYAGTSGGVERYNYLQSVWDTPLTACDGLPHSEVTVVAVDPTRGELWCGTRAGLAVYHTDLKTWRVYKREDGLPGDEIEEIVMGVSGVEGDYVYVKAAGTWTRIRKGIDSLERVPAGSVPREDAGKRRGPLDPSLFGSEKYPFLSPSTEPDENLETYPITALAEDSWGSLWLGTWGGNIRSISLVTHAGKAFRFGLASRSVTALEKGDGCMWFAGGGGTSPGGITKMDEDMSEWTYYEDKHERPLRGAVIRDLEAAGDRLWVATNMGLAGLDLEKGSWKKWGRRDGLPDDRVLCLDSVAGKLWVGTELGLAVIDLDSLSVKTVARLPVPLRVNDVTAGAGKVWVGTDKGFFSVEEKDSSLAPLAPLGGVRAEVFEVSCVGDLVYLASWNGLYSYDAKSGVISRDPHPGPVTGQSLLSIAVDDKNVWVGTDLGVERYDRESGAWVSYRPRNFELLAVPVTRILPDGDHVWFASPEGVTRFFWNEPSRAR